MLKLIISSVILTILDLIWIKLVMGPLYQKMIPNIQGTQMVVNKRFAMFSYLTLMFSINYFVLPNVENNNNLSYAFIFGLVLYGVYDFTGAAIFTKWDELTMFLDILWGGILFLLTAFLTNILEPILKKELDL